jgi:hypothetical protein
MNEKPDHCTSSADRDTMRDEYDFSNAKRGVTAGRYAEGANVVVKYCGGKESRGRIDHPEGRSPHRRTRRLKNGKI